MLDTSHPQSVHIFAASRLEDEILTLSKRIISLPLPERGAFLEGGLRVLTKLRTLNLEHFGGSSFIAAAIDDFESAFSGLISEPDPRLESIMPALKSLRSAKGFCTDFI
jgi:hypothetical protein